MVWTWRLYADTIDGDTAPDIRADLLWNDPDMVWAEVVLL